MIRMLFTFIFYFGIVVCYGQSQEKMNEVACNDYKKSDTQLNIVYQKILKEYQSDTAFIRCLKISQQIWIKFRDAELQAMYPGYTPTSRLMCWCYYSSTLTEERIKKLQIWLEGEVEGNVCHGSVKNK